MVSQLSKCCTLWIYQCCVSCMHRRINLCKHGHELAGWSCHPWVDFYILYYGVRSLPVGFGHNILDCLNKPSMSGVWCQTYRSAIPWQFSRKTCRWLRPFSWDASVIMNWLSISLHRNRPTAECREINTQRSYYRLGMVVSLGGKIEGYLWVVILSCRTQCTL
jgi:hypothetical protein